MIQDTRIHRLDDREARDGAYILYWMQASQRVPFNHALEYAARLANGRDLPLVVGFGLMDDYPDANARHYAFMLQGLRGVAEALADRRIPFVVRHGHPVKAILPLAARAALAVCDRGYLRHQVAWRAAFAKAAPCPVIEVETDVVVPIDMASEKLESAARTIRPKIERALDAYVHALSETTPARAADGLDLPSDLDVRDPASVLDRLKLDRSVAPVAGFAGGHDQAARRLGAFLRHHVAGYDTARNDAVAETSSFLSPYLHFGQISPVEIALKTRATAASGAGPAAFLEELIVRRELAANFVARCDGYDTYEGAVPDWARATLAQHRDDPRDPVYDMAALEAGKTHDPVWNAAMTEMRERGHVHNQVRMFWGKSILKWMRDPAAAFATALALNNRYFLDGRDINSYTNIAWLFGRHDRPFQERAILGQVRPFTVAALKRKFDVAAYTRSAGGRRQARPGL